MLFRLRTIAILGLAIAAWPLAAQARGCMAFAHARAHEAARPSGATQAARSAAHGLNLADLDRSVSPCQNFYQFADGGWIQSHQIPASHSSWGVIDELRLRNRLLLRGILEEAADGRARAKSGSTDQKLGDFYASCMNTQAIDAAAWRPLAPELRRIANLRTRRELEMELGRLQGMGVGALFRLGVGPDIEGSGRVIATADPGALGLPDGDEYLQNDPYSRQLREKYVMHVARMFHLIGDSKARARGEAQTVLRIETLLARVRTTPAGRSDPAAAFHKMKLSALEALTPHFSWPIYFQRAGVGTIDTIDVTQPHYFEALDHDLAAVPLADWKIYLRWRLIHHFAPDLSAPFVDENFDFYGRTLEGTQAIQPRWQRCVSAADRELAGPLGHEYVARAFSPSDKAAAHALVRNLVAAFRKDLQGLYWMAPSTRAAAIAKLDQLTIEVGYPDTWANDSGYRVTRGPFAENMIRGDFFHFHQEMARIGKPIDRSRWPVPVSSADAIYDPTRNEVVLPAGILQPPFFDPHADDALNYGGIGTVVGHELTHGFDEEGSEFDGQGRLKDWWTAGDRESFQQMVGCVVDQFNTYVAAGGVHENGQLVYGESIADIGGLTISYDAFRKTAEFGRRRKMQGFTPRQRFFLAYARVWAEKENQQAIRQMVDEDPHATAKFRVIGPLADFEAFARAFHCRARDAMVRPEPDRCSIW